MPLVPPKVALGGEDASTSKSVHECPSCLHPVTFGTDKFCRRCGLRILMQCSKCHCNVRPEDKFCASCGAKRWHFFELWRYGILHRSPVFILGVTAVTAVAYLSVCFWLRRR